MLMLVENVDECQGSDNIPWFLDFEQQDFGIEINSENKKLKTLIEEPPERELKKLPDHLEYSKFQTSSDHFF